MNRQGYIKYVFLAAAVMAMMLAFGCASAATSGKYTYTVTNGEATITDYNYTNDVEVLSIPDTLGGYPVTAIGDSAFEGDFYDDTWCIIPDGVTSIGKAAFRDCIGLDEITIPDSVTFIGESAFRDCQYLTGISISGSGVSIGDYAFYACGRMVDVALSGVTEIGDYAFYGCASMTGFTLPKTLTSIGDYAFASCNLTSLTLPDGLTSIGNSFFSGTVYCSVGSPAAGELAELGKSFIDLSYSDYLLKQNVNAGLSIEKYSGTANELVIPPAINTMPVTAIGYSAFRDCSSLTGISIPDSVASIGESAFAGCSSLTTIIIPEGVTAIKYGTFRDCSSLTGVSIPDSVANIESYAFRDCSSLTSLTIPDGVTTIQNLAFSGCGAKFYCNADSVSAFTLSEAGHSFMDTSCPDYELLRTDSGLSVVKYVGAETQVVIPSAIRSVDVTVIKGYAFSGLGSITRITVPDTVTGIEYKAIYNCSKLERLDLPDELSSIPQDAFYDCPAVNVYCTAGSSCAYSLRSLAFCYFVDPTCPDYKLRQRSQTSLSIEDYIGADTDLTIPQAINSLPVVSIGASAFYGQKQLTRIVVPDSVTNIGANAFYNCSALTDITLPDGLYSIESYAFYNCSSLTGITIPGRVSRIDAYAFSGCSGLTGITIPDRVNSIGIYAFRNCSGLTGINIPEAVTEIKDGVFYGCSGLTGLTLHNGIASIGKHAFRQCTGLAKLILPAGVQTIHNEAFLECAQIELGVHKGTKAHEWCESEGNTLAFELVHMSDTNCICTVCEMVSHSFGEECACAVCGIDAHAPDGDYICSYCGEDMSAITGTLKLPASVEKVEDWAFEHCAADTVLLPRGCTTVGKQAFADSTNLVRAYIPETVKEIAADAFDGCESLAIVCAEDSFALEYAQECKYSYIIRTAPEE